MQELFAELYEEIVNAIKRDDELQAKSLILFTHVMLNGYDKFEEYG